MESQANIQHVAPLIYCFKQFQSNLYPSILIYLSKTPIFSRLIKQHLCLLQPISSSSLNVIWQLINILNDCHFNVNIIISNRNYYKQLGRQTGSRLQKIPMPFAIFLLLIFFASLKLHFISVRMNV